MKLLDISIFQGFKVRTILTFESLMMKQSQALNPEIRQNYSFS